MTRQSSSKGELTFWLAQGGYQGIIVARERFDELTSRDITARAIATLKARGTYDPAKHSDEAKHQPLTAAEHIEVLALGEVLARHHRHPTYVDHALKAGVSWAQIAEAVGTEETHAREQYREWAHGQHELYAHYEGKFGISDDEYAAAIKRASEPPTAPKAEHEAGQ
jgi:predicted TPR repeat methyltransferase